MPHGYCFLWNPWLLALQVGSDALIAIAYFSIPAALFYFVRKRTDLPYRYLFVLFAGFIVSCGLTHVFGIVTVWQPLYWVDGSLKAITAITSIATALLLVPVIPKALALRSPAELIEVNDRLSGILAEQETLLASYERERNIATTLQRALLPQELPQIAGLRIDTAYRPATRESEVGGDWYDAFSITERLVGFSCGDVAGHGLPAAILMGDVRRQIREAAYESNEPAAVLTRVNRALCRESRRPFVTAFFGVLDIVSGELRYAVAGHPPAIASAAGAAPRFLPGNGLVLGVKSDAAYRTESTHLGEGSMLVLYTDGLIEAERDLESGLEKLAISVAREAGGASANVAEGVQNRVFSNVVPSDDSATIVVIVESLRQAAFAVPV